MVFDRKDYGMNKDIPFVRIGDSVDVTVDLKGEANQWSSGCP